jgi:hypothetical protein
MKNSSEIIWNSITDNAKKKFDYKSFEEQFIEIDENLADNTLFKIIVVKAPHFEYTLKV